MLKAATVRVVFINLHRKICDDLGQHLGRSWGAQAAKEGNWPRSCILGQTARAGLHSTQHRLEWHIVPLSIISLREKHSKCLTTPPTYKHLNTSIKTATAAIRPTYSHQLPPHARLFFSLWDFPASSCLTARYRPRLSLIPLFPPPGSHPEQDFSLRLAVSDWLPCCFGPAARSSWEVV